jgi:uncharacterized membrane protein
MVMKLNRVNNFLRVFVCGLILPVMVALIAGCSSHFKKIPKPGETIKEDISLMGYQTWVDFEVEPEVVYRYLQDTDNVAKAFNWVNFQKKGEDTGRLDVPGDGIHFISRVLGVPFRGRMVATSVDFPQRAEIFHVMGVWSRQQWWREDLEDGRARMHLCVYAEMPDVPFISKVVTPQMYANQAGRRVDYSFDRIKADLEGLPMPEEFPETPRGEVFSSTVRIYRTAIEIEKPKGQVYEYITKLENFNRASEMLNFDSFTGAEVLSKVGQQCRVVSTPGASFELSGRSVIVESRENRLIHHLIYFEESLAGFIVKLRRKGVNNTLLEYSFYYQIPDYSSEQLVTTLHAVSQLDGALRLALHNIKSALESNQGL